MGEKYERVWLDKEMEAIHKSIEATFPEAMTDAGSVDTSSRYC